MNYQLNFFYYRLNPNNVKFWIYARTFTLLLFLNTLGAAFKFTLPVLSIINIVMSFVFIVVLLQINKKKARIPFIKIQEDKIEFLCQEQDEIVRITAHDITKITARFCELKIYTHENIHSLNLAMIRQEKKRWEVKEMIYKIAHIDRLSVAS